MERGRPRGASDCYESETLARFKQSKSDSVDEANGAACVGRSVEDRFPGPASPSLPSFSGRVLSHSPPAPPLLPRPLREQPDRQTLAFLFPTAATAAAAVRVEATATAWIEEGEPCLARSWRWRLAGEKACVNGDSMEGRE